MVYSKTFVFERRKYFANLIEVHAGILLWAEQEPPKEIYSGEAMEPLSGARARAARRPPASECYCLLISRR